MSTSFHFYGVVCPIVLWRPRDILSEYFLVSTGQAGHLVPRRPSSCTELSSVGSPCTKLKRVPLEHPPGQAGRRLWPSTRRSNQDAACGRHSHYLQRTDPPLSPLACSLLQKPVCPPLFLFSTTPGILVSLQGHGFFGALKEKP